MFRLGWREIPCRTCIDSLTTNVSANPFDLNSRLTSEQINLMNMYLEKPKPKAIAFGENGIGGLSWGYNNVGLAIQNAINLCTQYGGVNCKIWNSSQHAKPADGNPGG